MNTENDHKNLPGWGIDSDPLNDPTYPLKDRTNEEHLGFHWKRPELQPVHQEILHSNERPGLTAVFGTSAPPKGLSGYIRRFAYRYSENTYRHWLPLLLADRVNVVEGIIEDLLHFKFPNILAERGMKARWKHEKGRLIRDMSLKMSLIAAAGAFLFRRKFLPR